MLVSVPYNWLLLLVDYKINSVDTPRLFCYPIYWYSYKSFVKISLKDEVAYLSIIDW